MAKPKKTSSSAASTDHAEQGAAYTVLARKFRPKNFDELIGQEAMVRTLTNAFASGRIAQAYMLTGVRGVGKTTTARILARALNYELEGVDGPTIDMKRQGEHCAAIMESRHVDVLEMDAASHTGIDDIREIIESVRYKPIAARMKVYIIDEVHMLSKAAFNGLLKTLEEPPDHVRFYIAQQVRRLVDGLEKRPEIRAHGLRNDLHRLAGQADDRDVVNELGVEALGVGLKLGHGQPLEWR